MTPVPTSPVPTSPGGPVTEAAAAVLGGVFNLTARLRGAKPLHPRGVVLRASISRHGAPTRWGVPWLDSPGEDVGVARLSRSVGMPPGWPDVMGLAIRFGGADRALHDLVIAGTGSGPLSRFVFAPQVQFATTYSSVMPYRTPLGPAVLGAFATGDRLLPGDPDEAARETAREPLVLSLKVASPTGPWRTFGTLSLGGAATETLDPRLAVDPVLRPLPDGLALTGPLARVRSVSYRYARSGRGATAEDLAAQPGPLHSA